tara:strand:+ start:4787 stop:5521 length:735 start_codon:yes stop_codon:yes gene_type:complete
MKINKLTIGSWITLSHPAIVEIMSKSGYDWLCIDMEHSCISKNEMTNLIRVIEANKCFAFVRVAKNDEVEIKKALDAGAHGIVVPQINSRKDALKLIEYAHYPPKGKRGVGLSRAQNYGRDLDQYMKKVNKDLKIIAIIESKEAIENLDEILDVELISGSMIGPYDLSASHGCIGQLKNKKVTNSIEKYEKIAKKYDKPFGFHAVNESRINVKVKIKKGYRFLAIGYDAHFLMKESDRRVQELK